MSKRHYCRKCKKKRHEEYMHKAKRETDAHGYTIYSKGRIKWECNECNKETRGTGKRTNTIIINPGQ